MCHYFIYKLGIVDIDLACLVDISRIINFCLGSFHTSKMCYCFFISAQPYQKLQDSIRHIFQVDQYIAEPVISKYFSFCQRTVICNNQTHYLLSSFTYRYTSAVLFALATFTHNVCTVNISCCNSIGTVPLSFTLTVFSPLLYCIYKICRFCNLESKALMKQSILTGSSNYISGTLTFKSNCLAVCSSTTLISH